MSYNKDFFSKKFVLLFVAKHIVLGQKYKL